MFGKKAWRALSMITTSGADSSDDAAEPSTEPGERVYVVGDVHGQLQMLRELLVRIDRDHFARGAAKKRLIFLGDLIDRGPHSADVVSLLLAAQQETQQLVVLMGNHEAALLGSLDGDGLAQRLWLEHGGRATLKSYGLEPPEEQETPDQFAHRLRNGIPPAVAEWLEKLPLSARSGSYFFCHAGVRPGVPLARQNPQDLLWIRNDFLDSGIDHGAVIVHGHTICGRHVEFLPNRINVDTGAYETGVLSALGLEDHERWVISTGCSSADLGEPEPVGSKVASTAA